MQWPIVAFHHTGLMLGKQHVYRGDKCSVAFIVNCRQSIGDNWLVCNYRHDFSRWLCTFTVWLPLLPRYHALTSLFNLSKDGEKGTILNQSRVIWWSKKCWSRFRLCDEHLCGQSMVVDSDIRLASHSPSLAILLTQSRQSRDRTEHPALYYSLPKGPHTGT